MFQKKSGVFRDRAATFVEGLGECDLRDTFECGQAFRYEETVSEEGYVEYAATAYGRIINVGQKKRGELIFYDEWTDDYEKTVSRYFAFDTDFEKIRRDVLAHTDSEWLRAAAESAKGIIILRQEPWETLLSFIISQNNNIPRIRKIIRAISLEYGKNLAVGKLNFCPVSGSNIDLECCKSCGICYSFPTPSDILARPEGLLPSHPGFRYKYMLDAAERVASGEVDLKKITEAKSYEHTLAELKKILGVGDKVASCVALFGFSNLEAFPIDVWMKRAIDEYFGGKLDPSALGDYAGVAQQYIFHYIRNLSSEK